MFQEIVGPGVGPGRHIHHQQDESFIFLEGTFDVEVNGQLTRMKEGDMSSFPKATVHAWKNAGEGAGRLRYIFSPGFSIEQMFRAIHQAHARRLGCFETGAVCPVR